MPIYEYYCTNCKMQFELVCTFSKSSKAAKCPRCKKVTQKLISNFASKTGSNLQPPEGTFRKLGVGVTRKLPRAKSKSRKSRKS